MRHPARWIAASVAAVVVVLGVVLALNVGSDPAEEAQKSPLLDKAVPRFELATLDGSTVSSESLAGKAVIVNFWNTWCTPCRAELPALAEYAARADAVPVVGVDVQDDPRSALALLRELGVTLPSVTDPDGALRGALTVPPALPISYVVRADGTVARVDPPTPFTSADEVAAAVERLGAGDR